MTLSAQRVREIQFFLLDAAKRYVGPSGAGLSAAGNLLSSAAALDYVLLLASERPGEMLDTGGPIAAGARETMTRAAFAALDFIRSLLASTDGVFDDFCERHIRQGRIFDTFRALSESGVLSANDVNFAIVTTASDVMERERRQ